MSEPHVYTGTFATGHVPMIGTTAIQFSENTRHEFEEEFKSAHGLKKKVGPGLAHAYDFRDQPKRVPPPLPVAGCALARMHTGNKLARRAKTSSQAVGGWWDDPIFTQPEILDPPVRKSGDKGAPPASTRITTSSEVGSYWHDPELEDNDEQMAILRAQNGAKRVLPVEMNSQFALEDLPTQHRLL
jgi:hypothetical protein